MKQGLCSDSGRAPVRFGGCNTGADIRVQIIIRVPLHLYMHIYAHVYTLLLFGNGSLIPLPFVGEAVSLLFHALLVGFFRLALGLRLFENLFKERPPSWTSCLQNCIHPCEALHKPDVDPEDRRATAYYPVDPYMHLHRPRRHCIPPLIQPQIDSIPKPAADELGNPAISNTPKSPSLRLPAFLGLYGMRSLSVVSFLGSLALRQTQHGTRRGSLERGQESAELTTARKPPCI